MVLNEKIIIETLLKDNNLMNGLDMMSSKMSKLNKATNVAMNMSQLGVSMNTSGGFIDIASDKLISFNEVVKRNTKLQKKMKKGFDMNALGIMFFGMAIKRTMNLIIKTATKTYMKITEGATLASRGMTRLNAEWEFFKFSVGSALTNALLPFLPKIIELVQVFGQWIREHPKLVAGLIALAAALGTVMFFVGQLFLGVPALINFFVNGMGGTALKAVINLFTGLSGTAMVVIGVVIALIVSFVDAWKKNFGGIRDWVGLMFDGMKQMFKGVFDFFGGIVDIFVGLFTGNFDKAKEGAMKALNGIKDYFSGSIRMMLDSLVVLGLTIINLFLNIGKFLLDEWKWVGGLWKKYLWDKPVEWVSKLVEKFKTAFGKIKNVILGIWDKIIFGIKTAINFVIGAIEKFLNTVTIAINKIIDGINKVFHTNLGNLANIHLGRIDTTIPERTQPKETNIEKLEVNINTGGAPVNGVSTADAIFAELKRRTV